MGVFVDDDIKEDANQIARTANRVQQFWNKYGREVVPFRVRMSTGAAMRIAQLADQVLAAAFPAPPSKFKRIGTLLVMSRLVPLFGFYSWENETGDDETPLNVPDQTAWLVRVCYLMVSPAFAVLKWAGGAHEQEQLNGENSKWRDFPSIHSKTEFLLFLEWLRDYETEELSYVGADQEILDRRCRMVLAASLNIEFAYYCRECPKPSIICGSCDDALKRVAGMKELLEYDKKLYDKYQQSSG